MYIYFSYYFCLLNKDSFSQTLLDYLIWGHNDLPKVWDKLHEILLSIIYSIIDLFWNLLRLLFYLFIYLFSV